MSTKTKTVHEKFIGQMVLAKRGRGQTKGTVTETKRIWVGNWILKVKPETSCIEFWAKSRDCRITHT